MGMAGARIGLTRKESYVLASLSRDGELLARMFKVFGVNAIRGSSSRKGASGLMELKKKVLNNANVGLAVDGPRGPRFKAKPGVIMLAKATGATVFPVACRCSKRIVTGSWDKTEIPLPFSTCTFFLGEPFTVPPSLTNEQLVGLNQQLEETLKHLKSDK